MLLTSILYTVIFIIVIYYYAFYMMHFESFIQSDTSFIQTHVLLVESQECFCVLLVCYWWCFLKETSLFILLNLTSVCNSSSVCASDHQAAEHALVSTLISALCHVSAVTPLSLLTLHSDKLLCYLSADTP